MTAVLLGPLGQRGDDTFTKSGGAGGVVSMDVTSHSGKGLGSPQDATVVLSGKASWRRRNVS